MAFFIAALVKFVIPAPASVAALLIATLYPVLRSAGLSSYTAACCISLGGAVPWGPSNSFNYVAFSNAGLDTSLCSSWTLTTQLRQIIPILLLGAVVIALTSRFFDKKEGVDAGREVEVLDVEGTPKFYALLPVLPVFVLLIFTFMLKITIGLVASVFISLLISMIVWTVTAREAFSFSRMLARLQPFYTETGAFLGGTGMLLIASNLFATVIGKIGGLNVLVEYASSLNMPPQLLIFVFLVIVVTMVALTGATIGMLPVFAPLFATLAAATGADAYILIGVLIIAVSFSGPIGLVYMSNLVASDRLGTRLPTLSKRNLIPCLAIVLAGYFLVMAMCF